MNEVKAGRSVMRGNVVRVARRVRRSSRNQTRSKGGGKFFTALCPPTRERSRQSTRRSHRAPAAAVHRKCAQAGGEVWGT